MNYDVEAWEGEGGATPDLHDRAVPLTGAVSQSEWTYRMQNKVKAKYNRPGSVTSIDCKTAANERAKRQAR